MGNRTAKFISALFASVLAGAPLTAVSQNAPSAQGTAGDAEDCLTSPKATAPQGQHWYYRIERGSKRQCWYLRDEGAKTAQTSTAPTQTSTSQTSTSQTPTSTTQTTAVQKTQSAAPKTDTPAQHSVQDARAEFTTQQTTNAPDTTASIPAPTAAVTPPSASPRRNVAAAGSAQQPAVAARWPDTSNAATSDASPAQAAQAAPTEASDAQPAPEAAPSPAPGTTAAADVPAAKPTGSLQTLLLVIGGALALAGITGSVIYRFAGARVRTRASEGRRRVNWERPADNAHAPWAEAAGDHTPRAQRPRPVDFGFALAQAGKAAVANDLDAPETSATETDGLEEELLEEDLSEDLRVRFAQDLKIGDFKIEDLKIEDPLDALEIELKGPKESRPVALEFHADKTDTDTDAVDIDAITAILERLAKEGPRLSQPTPEAGFADFAQTRRAQSGARA
jgi:hypothetical protein